MARSEAARARRDRARGRRGESRSRRPAASITPELAGDPPALRTASRPARTLETMRRTCQWARSLALRSAGAGRPSRGAGTRGARSPALRGAERRDAQPRSEARCSGAPARGRSSRSRRRPAARARRGRSGGSTPCRRPRSPCGRCRGRGGRSPMPVRIALARREPEDLEEVAVRVLEVEGADAAGVRVPVRQPLRRGRGVLDPVLAEPRIGPVHVAHDDRHVLEPAVVAARVGRHRAAPWASGTRSARSTRRRAASAPRACGARTRPGAARTPCPTPRRRETFSKPSTRE